MTVGACAEGGVPRAQRVTIQTEWISETCHKQPLTCTPSTAPHTFHCPPHLPLPPTPSTAPHTFNCPPHLQLPPTPSTVPRTFHRIFGSAFLSFASPSGLYCTSAEFSESSVRNEPCQSTRPWDFSPTSEIHPVMDGSTAVRSIRTTLLWGYKGWGMVIAVGHGISEKAVHGQPWRTNDKSSFSAKMLVATPGPETQ